MRREKRKIAVIITIAMLFLTFFNGLIPLQANQEKIRVGWPMQAGQSEKDENGQYSGYTYDYLNEIAQYTGWEYEFVEVEGDINEQLSTLMDMMIDGEIDIMGSMRYNDATAELFDFPSESYGSYYNVLAVADDNEDIDEYNLTKQKDMRIAVVKGGTTQRKRLEQYADMNSLSYTIVECENGADALEKIKNKEADLVLSVDVAVEDGYHPVAKFGGDSYYFAVSKKSKSIIPELNQAIINIQEAYPTLESDLYEQYFVKEGNFHLTADEKNYIADHPTLTAIYIDDIAPLSYTHENKASGAAVDLLDQIAELSGLKIKYIRAHSFAEYQEMIKANDYDILLTYPYQHEAAQNLGIVMSMPYLEIPLTMVARNGVDPADLKGKREAIIEDFNFRNIQGEDVYKASSVKDALNAINEGDADYFYGIGAMISYYTNQERYSNVQLIYGIEQESGQLSFAINEENNQELRAILNKALQAIPDKDMENYLYTHTYIPSSISIQDIIYDYPLETFLIVFAIILIILFAFYNHYTGQLKMKKQIELENNRYKMLAEISGESIFEYNYAKDLLQISGQALQKGAYDGVYEHFIESLKKNTEEHIRIENTMLPLLEHPQEQSEVLLLGRNDTLRWHRITARVMYDEHHEPIVMIGRISDIHEERLERERLIQDAEMDKLTNMYNADSIRRLIEESLPHAIAGRSVLMIADLDNFKEVNDRYGHYQGDQVLTQTGNALNQIFAPFGLVGRLGGDEFLLYLEQPENEDEILSLCQKLIHCLDELPVSKKLNHRVQISVGYVIIEKDRDFTTLYTQADKALYQVKEHGRNGIYKYHPDLDVMDEQQ